MMAIVIIIECILSPCSEQNKMNTSQIMKQPLTLGTPAQFLPMGMSVQSIQIGITTQ